MPHGAAQACGGCSQRLRRQPAYVISLLLVCRRSVRPCAVSPAVPRCATVRVCMHASASACAPVDRPLCSDPREQRGGRRRRDRLGQDHAADAVSEGRGEYGVLIAHSPREPVSVFRLSQAWLGLVLCRGTARTASSAAHSRGASRRCLSPSASPRSSTSNSATRQPDATDNKSIADSDSIRAYLCRE
jgi:hypothetical protein